MPYIGFIAHVLFESISLQLKAIFPSWTPLSSYSNFPLIQSGVFTLLCSLCTSEMEVLCDLMEVLDR